jgi:hypothetical protein
VEAGEVSHQLHEELDVSHLVQEVLVSQFVWLLVANCLLVGTGALAVLAHDGVLYHLTLFALQVLHLVRDQPTIG